jgi:hypothetical protein
MLLYHSHLYEHAVFPPFASPQPDIKKGGGNFFMILIDILKTSVDLVAFLEGLAFEPPSSQAGGRVLNPRRHSLHVVGDKAGLRTGPSDG